MATRKIAYAAAATVTCTLASLAATAGRESATQDNSTNLYIDALVQVQVKTDVGVPANDKAVYIYAWGTENSATPIYPDAVTGSDAAITIQSPTQLRLLGVLATPTASTTYKSEALSVAAAFGGSMPAKWGIVVVNSSTALTAVAGDHKIEFAGINETIV